ncbi:hypothetical protein [Actinoplanes sp. NPDC049599]|uniref:hypothetical protein n=1 Tax=Actinoplanes sp. NPDC049599 TaxID=3363903 RepID=UPI0037A2B310
MFAVPNSSAMDAAAGGRGPTATVLPWLAGAEPDQVLRYVTDLVNRITRIAGIVDQVGDAGGTLRKTWTAGSASDGAVAKVRSTVATFQKIVQAVETLQAEIVAVATALRTAQHAYRSMVSSVNPTVAALLSNIHTHAAARSLAVGTTSGLASFVSSVKAALDAIGAVRLMAVVTTLATIAKELESLLSDGAAATPGGAPSMITGPGAGAGAGAGLTGGTTSGAPGLGAPGLGSPGSGASAGGLGAGGFGAGGTGGTGTGVGGTGYGTGGWNDGGFGQAGAPPFGSGASASVVPPGLAASPATLPDPPGPGTGAGHHTSTPAGGTPAGGTGHDVTISTTHGDVTIDISVPAAAADDLAIDLTVTDGGETFTEHLNLDLDGSGADGAPAVRV